MTEDERELCWGLLRDARGRRRISHHDFLRQFPSALEGGKLPLRLLEEAYQAQSDEDLLCAMLVGFSFDAFGSEHTEILCRLVDHDWHSCHEDVVSVLDQLRTPDAIEALFRATQWIPKSLEYDEARALAVKAIWGLGNLPNPEAATKLETLARSDDAILRENAREQLARRQACS